MFCFYISYITMGEAPSGMTSHGSAATAMSVWDKSFQEHGVPHHHFKIASCSIPGRIFLHLPMQVLAGFIAGFCLGVKIVGINLWDHQHLQTLLRDSTCIALFAEVGVCQQHLCMFDAHACDAKGMGGFHRVHQPTNILASPGYDVPYFAATSVPWTDPVVAITTNAQLWQPENGYINRDYLSWFRIADEL